MIGRADLRRETRRIEVKIRPVAAAKTGGIPESCYFTWTADESDIGFLLEAQNQSSKAHNLSGDR